MAVTPLRVGMKVLVGAICMVAGVALMMWGRNLAYSLGGQVRYVFTGSPGDKPMLLMIGGGILIVIGCYQVFWKAR
jgi:hypothetical protein